MFIVVNLCSQRLDHDLLSLASLYLTPSSMFWKLAIPIRIQPQLTEPAASLLLNCSMNIT